MLRRSTPLVIVGGIALLAPLACSPGPEDDGRPSHEASSSERPVGDGEHGEIPPPGRYCFELSSETVTAAAQVTVMDDGQVTGEGTGVVHDDAEGYYTSYRQELTGTRSEGPGEVEMEIVTWIELDRQESRETWTLTAESLSDGHTELVGVPCEEVEGPFADPALEHGTSARAGP